MGQTINGDNGKSLEKKPDQTNKSEVFFGHGVAKHRDQRFTIAILPVNEHTVNVGVSVCGLKDQFNKKIGRSIAEGRARKTPTMTNVQTITLQNGGKLIVDTTSIEGMLKIKTALKSALSESIVSVKDILRYQKYQAQAKRDRMRE
jgi:hypothetical protein